jgi:hypothetical protein
LQKNNQPLDLPKVVVDDYINLEQKKLSTTKLDAIKSNQKIDTINHTLSKLSHETEHTNLNQYTLNNFYMINNNIAQYSSYIIVEDEDQKNNSIYRIETLVQYNFRHIKNYGVKENYLCLVKSMHTNKNIELDVHEFPRMVWPYYNRKIVFSMDLNIFNSTLKLDLNDLVIAVIWKPDYNKTLNSNFSLWPTLDPNSLATEFKSVSSPYTLINYQKPTILINRKYRSPTFGFCIHYLYQIPPILHQWIDYHLSIGIDEMLFYDSTDGRILTENLKKRYPNNEKIFTIMSYYTSLQDLCNSSNLLKQFDQNNLTIDIKEYLVNSCTNFFHRTFSRGALPFQHAQITGNDCYIHLSKRHEFMVYYDLDEFIFARNKDNLKDFYEKKAYYSPENRSSICLTNNLQNNFETKRINSSSQPSYFYNYIMEVIEKYRNNRSLSDLAAISFDHAAYLKYDLEKQTIERLGTLIKEIDNNSTNSSLIFPLKFMLYAPPPAKNLGHIFTIQKDDVDYIKYLYNAYFSLIPTIYEKFLRNITSFDESFIRYFYYATEFHEREQKTVLYYKNVNSVYLHYASSTAKTSWTIYPSPFSGHTSPHFRMDFSFALIKNATSSIKKLGIDFEYIFFLLKNHTNFCNT